jgi:hypothetical protein
LNPSDQLIFNAHRQPTVLLLHERRRNEEVRRRTIAGDWNVVNHCDAKERLDVHVVRMRLERIRKEHDKVNPSFDDCRADLLIATQWATGEASDVEPKLGGEDRACGAGCEEIVVEKDTPVATSPIEEVMLSIVMGDHGDALSGIHQEQTAAGHERTSVRMCA